MLTGISDPLDDLRDEVAMLREEVAMLRDALKQMRQGRFGAAWERRERFGGW